MTLVVTVLAARVLPDRVADLQTAYVEAAHGPFPPGLVRSSLLQDRSDQTQWRIETVWESQDALTAMRESPGKPRGVLIFETAGAQPSLSIFDTVADFVVSKGAA
ncbi:MAG TPA: antibiotic biosynthesis monooxygenase [Gemmatimonadales bacterium]|nr:antibiotic biosynthesis monooxygenase [Gemmatimonadales bacterium]